MAQLALVLIAALALFALDRSDLSLPLAVVLAVLVLAVSTRELRRMRQRPGWSLIVADAGVGNVEWHVDGLRVPVRSLAVHPRGPIIGVRLDPEDRPSVHALWWPDTLDAETRRALMLLARGQYAQQRSPLTPDSN